MISVFCRGLASAGGTVQIKGLVCGPWRCGNTRGFVLGRRVGTCMNNSSPFPEVRGCENLERRRQSVFGVRGEACGVKSGAVCLAPGDSSWSRMTGTDQKWPVYPINNSENHPAGRPPFLLRLKYEFRCRNGLYKRLFGHYPVMFSFPDNQLRGSDPEKLYWKKWSTASTGRRVF